MGSARSTIGSRVGEPRTLARRARPATAAAIAAVASRMRRASTRHQAGLFVPRVGAVDRPVQRSAGRGSGSGGVRPVSGRRAAPLGRAGGQVRRAWPPGCAAPPRLRTAVRAGTASAPSACGPAPDPRSRCSRRRGPGAAGAASAERRSHGHDGRCRRTADAVPNAGQTGGRGQPVVSSSTAEASSRWPDRRSPRSAGVHRVQAAVDQARRRRARRPRGKDVEQGVQAPARREVDAPQRCPARGGEQPAHVRQRGVDMVRRQPVDLVRTKPSPGVPGQGEVPFVHGRVGSSAGPAPTPARRQGRPAGQHIRCARGRVVVGRSAAPPVTGGRRVGRGAKSR